MLGAEEVNHKRHARLRAEQRWRKFIKTYYAMLRADAVRLGYSSHNTRPEQP